MACAPRQSETRAMRFRSRVVTCRMGSTPSAVTSDAAAAADLVAATQTAYGVEYHELVPLPFSEQAIGHVVARAREVQRRLRRPLLLENPTYYLQMPGAEMSEAEFVREVVERADCGLLLDVNNVYVNARNHGYDPYAFIDAMPRDRVRQLHLAGHDASGEFLVDTHGTRVDPAVLDLYAYTLRRLGPVWTLLEWDHDLPPLTGLLEENARVRAVGERAVASREAA